MTAALSDGTIARVWVPGLPRTKGSLDPRNMQDTPESKRWRAMMAGEVRAWRTAHGLDEPHDGPASVLLACWLPRPASSTPVEHWAPTWHQAGDVDKLARNVLDALSDGPDTRKCAGAYVDDNLVVNLSVTEYPADTHPMGILIVASVVYPDAYGHGLQGAERFARTAIH